VIAGFEADLAAVIAESRGAKPQSKSTP
jgi:hypothetical protein